MKPLSYLSAAILSATLVPLGASASTVGDTAPRQTAAMECDDAGFCRASGQVTESTSGKVLATIVLFANKTTDAQGMLIVTPLGTALMPGVRVGVGGTDTDIPYITCLPDGCSARKDMPAAEFKSILDQPELTIQFFPFAKDKPIAFRYDLGNTRSQFQDNVPDRTELFD